jgi:hypothetical protein
MYKINVQVTLVRADRNINLFSNGQGLTASLLRYVIIYYLVQLI